MIRTSCTVAPTSQAGAPTWPATSGTVGIDRLWSPHVQASLTLAGSDAAVWDPIRYRASAVVKLTRQVDDGAVQTKTFNLNVREQGHVVHRGEVRLRATSWESILSDHIEAFQPPSSATNIAQLVNETLKRAWFNGETPPTLDPSSPPGTEALPRGGMKLPRLENAWTWLAGYLEQYGRRLVCTAEGRWMLYHADYVEGTASSWDLSSITEWTRTRNRDAPGSFTGAIVVENVQGQPPRASGYGMGSTTPDRVGRIERFDMTSEQLDDLNTLQAAIAISGRAVERYLEHELVMPWDFRPAPGAPITLDDGDPAGPFTATVEAVTYDVDGTMRVVAYGPDR